MSRESDEKGKEEAGDFSFDPETGKPSESHIERLRGQTAFDVDSAASHKLDRKFDLHIVPWLFGIW